MYRRIQLASVLCAGLLLWAGPAAATPSQPRQPLVQRVGHLVQGLRHKITRTWRRWNRPPSRSRALRPLQRMIDSGRIAGSDLQRVRALYPELKGEARPQLRLKRTDPRMKPLFRLYDRGDISRQQLLDVQRALGR